MSVLDRVYKLTKKWKKNDVSTFCKIRKILSNDKVEILIIDENNKYVEVDDVLTISALDLLWVAEKAKAKK